MKKATYSKSEIMQEAWNFFNMEEYAESNNEYFEFGTDFDNLTFGQCLKASWKKEKEVVDRLNAKYENAEKSEEVKAWDWAAKKLGVEIEKDAYTKMVDVDNMMKETWNGSVWSAAMKAVKLSLKLGA